MGSYVKSIAGSSSWHKDAACTILHRDDGPAYIGADGSEIWYQYGEKHRDDGPAWVQSDGTKLWYLRGELHREDAPAIEWHNGAKAWYLHGERHRLEGPAVVWGVGNHDWWLFGQKMDFATFAQFQEQMNTHIGEPLLPYEVLRTLFKSLSKNG